ncbi:MAG TPA: mandelate racemase/muconate lactonizing enzyme family protein [Dehalococcoidia bacterium]|jgi:galactonate dehydratase|nr:mandelate racemase/muconate lactonizing enzyme family protein [Dehalococcoidia bacterium]HIM59085.1 mandelate racemase/muconate lactonizing enzyme family protein [Dehalococcoidia bacterium]HIN15572.1 mandelate racemase/muconate lactonizing enzyme family protein [Dehalococcoidia bacterium]
MPSNFNFSIRTVNSIHLAFKGSDSYWESYRAGEGDRLTERFEFKQGWQTVYARYIETPLVKVTLSDGTVGWGEANAGIGPEVVCLIVNELLAQMIEGQEFENPAGLWDFLYDSQRGRGYSSGYWLDALAAIDIAVWDAIGKREQSPVAALLVPVPRKRFDVYLSGVRRATLEERVDHVNSWIDTGLKGAKIFLTGDVDAGADELDGLMRGAPGLEQWMVDTLWMCSHESAEIGKRVYGDRGVRFFECPLQPEDLAGHQELVTKPGAPIALGEHFRSRYQMEAWVQKPRALDVYQPDIGRTGFTDYMIQKEIAEKVAVPTTPHMGSGVSVFQAATLQCAAVASPEFLQEFQGGLSDRLAEASDTGWQYRDGGFELPDRPGIGVEINEALLEPFIVKG